MNNKYIVSGEGFLADITIENNNSERKLTEAQDKLKKLKGQ